MLLPTLLGENVAFGQNDSTQVNYDNAFLELQEITAEDLEKFKNDSKFNYEIEDSDPTIWDDFQTWLGNLFQRFFEWLFGVEEASGAMAIFLRVLPYVLLAVLLFLLIKFFLSVNSRAPFYSRKASAVVSISEDEHIIKNEDIQKLIQNALTDKNYRLAIRYYYLYILQLMSKKELIDWQLQKTNHDYEREITESNLKTAFSKITRLYDYIWYGDFDIDEKQYVKAETVFTQLRNTLKDA